MGGFVHHVIHNGRTIVGRHHSDLGNDFADVRFVFETLGIQTSSPLSHKRPWASSKHSPRLTKNPGHPAITFPRQNKNPGHPEINFPVQKTTLGIQRAPPSHKRPWACKIISFVPKRPWCCESCGFSFEPVQPSFWSLDPSSWPLHSPPLLCCNRCRGCTCESIGWVHLVIAAA